jgi:hypothetical protein
MQNYVKKLHALTWAKIISIAFSSHFRISRLRYIVITDAETYDIGLASSDDSGQVSWKSVQ